MRTKLGVILGVGLFAALSGPGLAHHSWTADYDGGKPVTVKGVVSKVEWTNPHTHFYLDVKTPDGSLKTWNFEMASTLSLERGGWTIDDLCVLTIVTVRRENGGVRLTSNLLAPVLIDTATKQGRQVILQNQDWPVQAPLAESSPEIAAATGSADLAVDAGAGGAGC